MNQNLEAKLRKGALISGLALKAGVGCLALATGYNLIEKEYIDAAKYASFSASVSIASYTLLSYAGIAYTKVFVNYLKKRVRGRD